MSTKLDYGDDLPLMPNANAFKYYLYTLALGLFVLLTGRFLIADGSTRTAQTYLWLSLPALIHLMVYRFRDGSLFKWRPSTVEFAVIAFGFWVLCTTQWPTAGSGFATILKQVSLIGLFIYAVYLLSQQPRLLQQVLYLASMAAALVALVTIVNQYIVHDRPLAYRSYRLFDMGLYGMANFKNPVNAAMIMGVFPTILLAIWLQGKQRKLAAVATVMAIIVLLSYLLLTYVRTSWMGFAAGAGVLVLLSRNRRALLFALIASIALSVLLLFFWSNIYTEIHVKQLSNRTEIWTDIWPKIQNNLWFGHGVDAKYSFEIFGRYFVNHSHSLYLQLWYELGLVGLLLYVSVVLGLIKGLWSNTRAPVVLSLGLLAYAQVLGVSDLYNFMSGPSYYWSIIWLPIALGLAQTKLTLPDGGGASEKPDFFYTKLALMALIPLIILSLIAFYK